MPRKIILIRHGESEGNVDWKVLSYKPDEKLELTPKGRQQALDAGKAIKAHLREGDRVRFYVSPYLRTRQTFEFITESFGGADQVSSFEEPRLREQDWGNFQNFVEMESIKAERRRYGTFFYRMPHGESGADVYDRISTFLESMYRSLLTKPEPPSVVVIVTHGLLARLFIMRWFRKSVREFQSWRSLNNCELLVMERNDEQR
ncbi:phosphoglycerate mutase-like protein [Gonapodya prolifera JEL478]|uniref:Phosphoglycerate mutase-like protein n=1 Tax=Gonapodya prolifera (strain JEL478) TaxID=1344416 RepID=A0A139AB74_GONPJ|nr:phosphoglycerate mutase-like protein [Gonapodya prolifera JEL478]|eukprot:KXS14081.1 phosphoglycerate mutase-like protein [Gonapodya prolifera JEL478]